VRCWRLKRLPSLSCSPRSLPPHSQTLHDLTLAACTVADGGIVIVDDFMTGEWMGVVQAVYLFNLSQDRLVPFLWARNKLYWTTPSHYELYLEFVKADPQAFPCKTIHKIMGPTHKSRMTFFDKVVCRI
jgi:hypothetical protein